MIVMENNVYLKEIEKRAYLSYHKDGILDIYLGMGIAMASSIFFIEYLPSLSVAAPKLLPLRITFTPIKGSLFVESITIPDILEF